MKIVSSMFVLFMFDVHFVWMCLNSSWFCIQQALGCEKQVECLGVTANLLTQAQMPQIRKWGPHPYLRNYCFWVCLQSFMILLQWALSCKKWVKNLRVIANLSFWTLLTQRMGHAMPIFRGIIALLEYIYNLVMILHPTSSWLWNSGLVFESQSQLPIWTEVPQIRR